MSGRLELMAIAVCVVACGKAKEKTPTEPSVPLADYKPTTLAVSYRGPAFAKLDGELAGWPPLADVGSLIGPLLLALNGTDAERARAFESMQPQLVADHPLIAYSVDSSLASVDHDGRGFIVSCGHAELGELADGTAKPTDRNTKWLVSEHRLPLSFRTPTSLVAHGTISRGVYLGPDHSPLTPLSISLAVPTTEAEAFKAAHEKPGSLQCHHLVSLVAAKQLKVSAGDKLAYINAKRAAVRLVSTARGEILYDSLSSALAPSTPAP